MKIEMDACLRECVQLDGRGSGSKELDGGSMLNPRSEDAQKTVSGRDVEVRLGVRFMYCN